MSLIITDAGIAAAIRAGDLGIEYKITHISIGSEGYVPEPSQTELRNELQKKAITRGALVAPGQLHFETVWNGVEEFEGKELGYWLEDGTLFAVDSRDGDIITYKRKNTVVTEACELNLSASTISNITVELLGSPYATETVAGIAKIATAALVSQGTDDETIVTPKKLKEVFSDEQFAKYNPTRIYSVGEVCYTKDAEGRVSYWEWYSNVESLAGKDPLDTLNRQTGWTDETKPFYWTPFKKSRAGSTQWPWMSMTFPEGTLNVVGNSVPTAVFWRLAEALPEFVNAGTGMIDFPETGGEFFRVLDQGRGINIGRGFNTLELDEFKSHNHLIGLQDIPSQGGGGVAEGYGNLDAFGGSMSSGGAETRPRNLAFPILVEV